MPEFAWRAADWQTGRRRGALIEASHAPESTPCCASCASAADADPGRGAASAGRRLAALGRARPARAKGPVSQADVLAFTSPSCPSCCAPAWRWTTPCAC
jgi:hypothetical protein